MSHRLISSKPDEPNELDDLERRNSLRDATTRALGALLIAAPLAPVLAAVLSVLGLAAWFRLPATDLQTTSVDLWQVALGNLVLAWLALAAIIVALGLSTARGALPGTYGELVQWLVEIQAWLKQLSTEQSPLPSLYARVAYCQLDWQYRLIRRELAENGSSWFVGTGYVNVWRRVHQAQETLIRLVSADALPEAARCELLRYSGSDISGSDGAIVHLQAALAIVDSKQLSRSVGALTGILDQLAQLLNEHQSPALRMTPGTLVRACDEVVAALDEASSTFQGDSIASLRAAVQAVSTNPDLVYPTADSDPARVQSALATVQTAFKALKPSVVATTPTNVDQARDVIKAMRAKADQYRDKARSGLTRARSDLTRTLTMTAMLSYALFWVVLEARYSIELAQLPGQRDDVRAAMDILQMAAGGMVLFLWGALVGLFGQLWTKWNANPDTGEDDFGLSISRGVAEPILAGLAGMCGVVVLTVGGPLLNQGLQGLSSANPAQNLQNAFLPGTSPASLLFAALFALSPNLLITRLQQAGANLQQKLSTSSPGDGGGMSSSS